MKRLRLAPLIPLFLAPRVSHAQTPPRPWAVAVGTGVTIIPSPAGDCAGGGGGFEAQGGVMFRTSRHLLIEADVRTAGLVRSDCAGVGRAVDTSYASVQRYPDPYVTSSLKVGYETPAPLPLLRFTVGGGALVRGHPSGFAMFGVAWSTRGPRGRLFIEAERTETRIRGTETRHDFVNHVLPDITRSFNTRASTQAYRIGLEWPLRNHSR